MLVPPKKGPYPISDHETIAERIRETELEAYQEEYSELLSVWRDLDSKAQGTAGIAGLFLAGALAFVRQLSELSQPGTKALLALITISLAVAILYAIRALRVRGFAAPPGGARITRLKNLILPDGDHEPDGPDHAIVESHTPQHQRLSDRDYVDFLAQQVKDWSPSVRDVRDVIDTKADMVSEAQRWLLIGAITAAVTTVAVIVVGGL